MKSTRSFARMFAPGIVLIITLAFGHGAGSGTVHLAAGSTLTVAGLPPTTSPPAEHWAMVAWGTVVSAIVSFLVVKWLLRFVQSHTFEGFGWYRIAAGLAILLFFL